MGQGWGPMSTKSRTVDMAGSHVCSGRDENCFCSPCLQIVSCTYPFMPIISPNPVSSPVRELLVEPHFTMWETEAQQGEVSWLRSPSP